MAEDGDKAAASVGEAGGGGGGKDGGEEEKSVKLFVGQVPKHMTEADLLAMFREVAAVDEVTVIKDKVTKVSRGADLTATRIWARHPPSPAPALARFAAMQRCSLAPELESSARSEVVLLRSGLGAMPPVGGIWGFRLEKSVAFLALFFRLWGIDLLQCCGEISRRVLWLVGFQHGFRVH